MLLIKCPVCGVEGDETDFHYGGEAHVLRPASEDPSDVTDEAQRDYLYMRKNPRGEHNERWLCERGCSKWFHAVRDTVTMVISHTYLMSEKPPSSVSSPSKKGGKK